MDLTDLGICHFVEHHIFPRFLIDLLLVLIDCSHLLLGNRVVRVLHAHIALGASIVALVHGAANRRSLTLRSYYCSQLVNVLVIHGFADQLA